MISFHVDVPTSVAGHVRNVDEPPLQLPPEHETPTEIAVVEMRFEAFVEPIMDDSSDEPGVTMLSGVNTTVALSRFEQNHRFGPPSAPPGPTCLLAVSAGETSPVAPVLPLAVAAINAPGRPLDEA